MTTTKVSLNNLPCYHPQPSLGGVTGLFCLLFLLSGCQAVSTPKEVTTAFWQAMADGNLDSARQYATQETQDLVTKQQHVKDATVKTGVVSIDGSNATVSTILTLKKPQNIEDLSFDTVLLIENDLWKVDYQRTLNNLLSLPFADIFKTLRAIGDILNQQLKQQMPLIEEQIKSFSEELIKQLDEFRRQLEKPIPPAKQEPHSGTI